MEENTTSIVHRTSDKNTWIEFSRTPRQVSEECSHCGTVVTKEIVRAEKRLFCNNGWVIFNNDVEIVWRSPTHHGSFRLPEHVMGIRPNWHYPEEWPVWLIHQYEMGPHVDTKAPKFEVFE